MKSINHQLSTRSVNSQPLNRKSGASYRKWFRRNGCDGERGVVHSNLANGDGSGRKSFVGSGRRSLKPRPTISASCARTEGDVSKPARGQGWVHGAPDSMKDSPNTLASGNLGEPLVASARPASAAQPTCKCHKDRLPKLGVFPKRRRQLRRYQSRNAAADGKRLPARRRFFSWLF